MTTYEYILLGCVICGIIMVVGGIILLYKGAIKLESASSDPALVLEVQKKLKLTTHIPALGLFIIGLLFVFISIFWGKSTAVKEIQITGSINVDDDAILVVKGDEWQFRCPSKEVNLVARPHLDTIYISVTAPGYQSRILTPYKITDIKDEINLGSITLVKEKVEKPEVKSTNIAPLPPGRRSVPLLPTGSLGIGSKP